MKKNFIYYAISIVLALILIPPMFIYGSDIHSFYSYIDAVSDTITKVYWPIIGYTIFLILPIAMYYTFYYWTIEQSFEKDSIKVENTLLSKYGLILIIIVISISISIYGLDASLSVLNFDWFNFKFVRNSLAVIGLSSLAFFLHTIGKIKQSKSYFRFMIVPIMSTVIIYLSFWMISFEYDLIFGRSSLKTFGEDMVAHYEWMPLSLVAPYIFIFMCFVYARSFIYKPEKDKKRNINPVDPKILPKNNKMSYSIIIDESIAHYESGQVDQKVINDLTQSRDILIDQETECGYLIDRWKGINQLTDAEINVYSEDEIRQSNRSPSAIENYIAYYTKTRNEIRQEIIRVNITLNKIYTDKNRGFGDGQGYDGIIVDQDPEL